MDVYSLINSKAISNHCRKIKHEFNTEEIAVLIFRNRRMSIEEKISAYEELIRDYPDMEVIKRINCKHYDSVKDMIQGEITRLKTLTKKLMQEEQEVIYTYIPYYESVREYRDHDKLGNIFKTYKETVKKVTEEIKEDEDILMYNIQKKSLKADNYRIIAEHIVKDNKSVMINIYNSKEDWLDIDNIFLNIPNPFKKGDILVSYCDTPFVEGIMPNKKNIFVLDWVCTWQENLQEILDRGCKDSSDMCGMGYFIDDYKELVNDHQFAYDSWEYFDGELQGMQRLLKGVSSLIKGKLGIQLFLESYEEMKRQENKTYLNWITPEGLRLAGFTEKDIEEINKK